MPGYILLLPLIAFVGVPLFLAWLGFRMVGLAKRLAERQQGKANPFPVASLLQQTYQPEEDV